MSNYTLPDYRTINENFDPTPMLGEVFKPVPGYEGHYSVSNYGRVTSHKGKQTRVLKSGFLPTGHLKVGLCRDGKMKTSRVHRLVALAHLGPAPADKSDVLHANDVKVDNRLSNLRFGTPAENHRDRVLNGGCPHANKTHCKYGHEFVVASTRTANGRRQCIACKNARNAAYYAAKTGRAFNVTEDADRRYIELTTAPDADLTPVISITLAQAADDHVTA